MPTKYICYGCEEDPCILEIAMDATFLPTLCPWGGKATWEKMGAQDAPPTYTALIACPECGKKADIGVVERTGDDPCST